MSDVNGMQDIGSMQMGVFSQNNQQKPQKNKPQASLQLPLKIVIPAGVIVIAAVLLLLFLPGRVAENHAKETCVAFCSLLAGEEVQWDKYYPQEIAAVMAEEFEDAGEIEDDSDVTVDDIEVETVKKLNVKENKAVLNKVVKEFYEELDVDEPEKIKVKRGYVVGVTVKSLKESGYMLVLQLDGKYGIYGVEDEEDFEGMLII